MNPMSTREYLITLAVVALVAVLAYFLFAGLAPGTH